MLHELGGFVNCSDSLIMLTILSHPYSVLGISVILFGCIGFLIGFNVFDSLSYINLSFCKSISIIISHLSIRSDLSFVVVNCVVKIVENSVTRTDICSSDIIVL